MSVVITRNWEANRTSYFSGCMGAARMARGAGDILAIDRARLRSPMMSSKAGRFRRTDACVEEQAEKGLGLPPRPPQGMGALFEHADTGSLVTLVQCSQGLCLPRSSIGYRKDRGKLERISCTGVCVIRPALPGLQFDYSEGHRWKPRLIRP